MAPLYTSFTLQSSLIGLGGVFVLSLSYLVGLAVYNLYFHPLAIYPGPKICAITRIPFLWALVQGKQTHNLRKLHKIYGDVVRIAPNELSYTNPSAWKDIYAHRQGKPEMGKYRTLYSEHPGADHIVIADRENHSRLRKSLSHGFSEASMRQQESLIQRYVDLLMRGLEQSSNDGQTPLNMCSWYNWTTFDIIGDLTFGEPFGCLENSTYHPWVSMIMDSIKLGAYMQALRYVPFGRKLAMLLVPKKLVAKKKAHHEMTIEKVKRRVELKEERADFLGSVLKRRGEGFTFPELVSNSSILIFAGSETTATALSGMTYYILKNPSSMATLVHEVRSAFSHNDEITINSVGNLKYMLACINETLRMFPPAAVGFPRVVPEGGDLVAGKWVPAGTVVGVSMLATYHSPDNFHDPDFYIPERFLGDPRFVNDSKIALNAFSLGPRNCIGKNLAYAEMRLIMAKMLFNFDLELDDGRDWDHQRSYTAWEKHPLNVKLKKVVR